ncbi:type II toxin-antitoxin system HigB family toxin [Spirosoma spitsbergense]|uniref:type II toxin-antitoxin system HigB family toxin n=1 Tax=Spirosoma spitsbergense TaxID=431554 RepID=UPI0003603BE2|nr:type II toxin-antitoxin system HigB family toxin [Spirosoma spitsbergense]
MRLIAKKTIVNFYTVHASAKGSLEAFAEEVKAANWQKPSDVIAVYPSADVITGKRFVFNIKGNSYRLVADIEFRLSQVYIVWIGTHAEYSKVDVKTVSYVKSN